MKISRLITLAGLSFGLSFFNPAHSQREYKAVSKDGKTTIHYKDGEIVNIESSSKTPSINAADYYKVPIENKTTEKSSSTQTYSTQKKSSSSSSTTYSKPSYKYKKSSSNNSKKSNSNLGKEIGTSFLMGVGEGLLDVLIDKAVDKIMEPKNNYDFNISNTDEEPLEYNLTLEDISVEPEYWTNDSKDYWGTKEKDCWGKDSTNFWEKTKGVIKAPYEVFAKSIAESFPVEEGEFSKEKANDLTKKVIGGISFTTGSHASEIYSTAKNLPEYFSKFSDNEKETTPLFESLGAKFTGKTYIINGREVKSDLTTGVVYDANTNKPVNPKTGEILEGSVIVGGAVPISPTPPSFYSTINNLPKCFSTENQLESK